MFAKVSHFKTQKEVKCNSSLLCSLYGKMDPGASSDPTGFTYLLLPLSGGESDPAFIKHLPFSFPFQQYPDQIIRYLHCHFTARFNNVYAVLKMSFGVFQLCKILRFVKLFHLYSWMLVEKKVWFVSTEQLLFLLKAFSLLIAQTLTSISCLLQMWNFEYLDICHGLQSYYSCGARKQRRGKKAQKTFYISVCVWGGLEW